MTELRPAATLLLVRDGARGLEVLMVERHANIGGSMVFPGGKTEESDFDPVWLNHTTGLETLADEARAIRIAALRETFEEAGLLFARRPGANTLLAHDDVEPLTRYQSPLISGEASLLDITREHELELACEHFVHFAQWNQPKRVGARRLAVHFFIAGTPEGQFAAHDGWESVDSTWIRPGDALEKSDAGTHKLAFPTRMVLRRLDRSSDVGNALEAAAAIDVVPMETTMKDTPDGVVGSIPARAGFDAWTEPMEGFTPGTQNRS